MNQTVLLDSSGRHLVSFQIIIRPQIYKQIIRGKLG